MKKKGYIKPGDFKKYKTKRAIAIALFLCQLAYISKNSLSNILYLFLPILSSFSSFTKSLRTLEREGLSTPKKLC